MLRGLYKLTGTDSLLNQNSSLNARNLFILFTNALLVASFSAYILCDASTVEELCSSFFNWLTALAIIMNFLIHSWKTPVVLDLFRQFEEFIEISKLVEFIKFCTKSVASEPPLHCRIGKCRF